MESVLKSDKTSKIERTLDNMSYKIASDIPNWPQELVEYYTEVYGLVRTREIDSARSIAVHHAKLICDLDAMEMRRPHYEYLDDFRKMIVGELSQSGIDVKIPSMRKFIFFIVHSEEI